MKRELDVANWNRKDHFNFFSRFDEPFYGATVEVNCTGAYRICKHLGHSFFLYYLHKTLIAVNRIEALCYRQEGAKVFEYDTINASATINRPDGTFGFSNIKFHDDFRTFQEEGRKEVDRVRSEVTLNPDITGQDVIHFSALPWLRFTSLSHARNFGRGDDSVPKISFGKLAETNGIKSMPVSIHVNHALVDGSDLGAFFDQLGSFLE